MNRNQQCPICLNIIIEQCILKCQHYFCKSCLIEYFQDKLHTKQLTINDFQCLVCFTPISTDILRELNQQLYQNYTEYSLQNNCIDGMRDDEQIVDCLNNLCQNKMVISTLAKYQKCDQCKQKYCRQCFNLFDKYCCQQQVLGQCPKCKIQIIKQEGCNFVRCKSSICKGQTYFCLVCCRVLTDKAHYNHYIDNNPYLDCKFKQSVQANQFKCPNCSTLDPHKCKIDLVKQQCQCNSQICNGRSFCLKCGNGVNINYKHECPKQICYIF